MSANLLRSPASLATVGAAASAVAGLVTNERTRSRQFAPSALCPSSPLNCETFEASSTGTSSYTVPRAAAWPSSDGEGIRWGVDEEDEKPVGTAPFYEGAASPAQGSSSKRTSNVNCDQEMIRLRRIFLSGEINDETAKVVVQHLLWMEAEDPQAPVTLFINSGGGLVHAGLAILDVMRQVSMPVETVAYGRCYSVAAVLVSGGSRGRRRAFPNARLLIHEPSCAYSKATVSDLTIRFRELEKTAKTLEEILSAHTGRTHQEVRDFCSRDHYFSVEEAVAFGLIDGPVTRPSPRPAKAAAKPSTPAASVDPAPPPPVVQVRVAPPPATPPSPNPSSPEPEDERKEAP